MNKVSPSLMLLVMAGAIAAGLTLWRMGLMQGQVPEAPAAWVPELVTAEIVELTEPSGLPVVNPIETRWSERMRTHEVGPGLIELLGAKAVALLLQIDEFPRRFVATIDNLARDHAPPMLWPVHPAPDRFIVDEVDGGPVIGADNAGRYTPLVLLAEGLATVRAVDLYVRMYPLLQQSYETLGFPRRYFNDRLIAVIDLLLATPEVEYPVKLQLTEVKGPFPSVRPWVRYEFADPALESLTAGQKILVRVGTANQRRLKAALEVIRTELVKRSPQR